MMMLMGPMTPYDESPMLIIIITVMAVTVTTAVKVGTEVWACWGAITGGPMVVGVPGHTEATLRGVGP